MACLGGCLCTPEEVPIEDFPKESFEVVLPAPSPTPVLETPATFDEPCVPTFETPVPTPQKRRKPKPWTCCRADDDVVYDPQTPRREKRRVSDSFEVHFMTPKTFKKTYM